jgi:hypothetical protein
VDPGPVLGKLDEVLLGSLFEKVAQAIDLRLLGIGDGNSLVAALEERPGPVVEAGELFGEVGVQEAHEIRELLLGLRDQEEVVVVGEKAAGDNLHVGVSLGSSEGALNGEVHQRGRPQKEAALNCAARDLYEAVGEQAAESSSHQNEGTRCVCGTSLGVGSLVSPGSFHHQGAFGTYAWGDPATGVLGVWLGVTLEMSVDLEQYWNADLFQNLISAAVLP